MILRYFPSRSTEFLALCGWFADHCNSRRLPLLLGLLALAGSTLMLCLGTSVVVLLVARILQGISASVVYTVGLALLVDTVGPSQIGEMIGYVSLSSTVAILLGPLLGGVIYAKAGYYAVYYTAFGLITLDIILRTILIEKKIAKQWEAVEEPTQQEIDSATHSEESDPHHTTVPDGDAQTPQANGSPSPPKSPLPPVLVLLSSCRLWSALICTLAQSVLMSVWDATLPLRVNKLFGWTSLGSSFIFLPFLIPAFVAPLVGIYIDKHGPRGSVTFGFLLCVIPLALLRLVTHDGTRQIVLLCALCSIIGLCLTITMVPFLAEITYVVAAKEKAYPRSFSKQGAYAMAFGIYNSSFSAGMLIGPLWGGFLVEHAGWATLTWTLALLSAVCVVPACLWTGGWIANSGTAKSAVVANTVTRSEAEKAA